jgi:hypothetical protein
MTENEKPPPHCAQRMVCNSGRPITSKSSTSTLVQCGHSIDSGNEASSRTLLSMTVPENFLLLILAAVRGVCLSGKGQQERN